MPFPAPEERLPVPDLFSVDSPVDCIEVIDEFFAVNAETVFVTVTIHFGDRRRNGCKTVALCLSVFICLCLCLYLCTLSLTLTLTLSLGTFCPAYVPFLSRLCPVCVPFLSRSCPGIVPLPSFFDRFRARALAADHVLDLRQDVGAVAFQDDEAEVLQDVNVCRIRFYVFFLFFLIYH